MELLVYTYIHIAEMGIALYCGVLLINGSYISCDFCNLSYTYMHVNYACIHSYLYNNILILAVPGLTGSRIEARIQGSPGGTCDSDGFELLWVNELKIIEADFGSSCFEYGLT